MNKKCGKILLSGFSNAGKSSLINSILNRKIARTSSKPGKTQLINHIIINNNWAVVAEAIQTILRRINYPKPYEALKELTRTNTKIDKNNIKRFIDSLDISEEIKSELKNITPENFTGIH